MAQKRPRRLPTDFFDRLLSNQTDDQINDLLTSLVDEQITPTAEAETAPPMQEDAGPAVRRGFHRDNIEDSILTRDEELDAESVAGNQEIPRDEIIPRTKRMQSAASRAAEEAPARSRSGESQPAIKFPGADDIEIPHELISDAPRSKPKYSIPVPDMPEIPEAPAEAADESAAWPPESLAVPEVPLPPEEEGMAAMTGKTESPEWAPAPGLEAEPVLPTPARAATPTQESTYSALPPHAELMRARLNSRWEKHQRRPKKPKLAKAVKPISFAPPRPDALSHILGDMDKAERKFRFTKLHRAAMVFLFPAFICFSFFSWYPMIKGFILSLYDYHPTGATTFVGFENYARVFQDEMFWHTLLHAGWFCALVLALGFWLPILLGIFINELRLGKGLLKFMFFLPFLMPAVPAAILWKWIMDQGIGLLNSVLSVLPLADPHIGWLTSPKLALLSIVLVYVWKNTGWALLIYTAALGNIDETMYEEAEIDGASLWSKVRHITLPAIRGVVSVMLIITIINTIQLFTEVYIMTNGGPMNATEMIATYIYKQAFFYMDFGYASALSMIMLLLLLIITTFRLKRLSPEGGER